MEQRPSAPAAELERQFDLQPGALGAALACMVAELPAGLCIHDIGGRFLFVNHRMAELFERSVDELTMGGISDWLEPAEIEELRAAEHAAANLATAQSSFHSICVGGRRRGFFVTRRALQNADEAAPVRLCSIWREHGGEQPERNGGSPRSNGAAADAAAAVVSAGEAAPAGRALFDDQLRRELDLSSREHREFALVSISIDKPDQSAPQPDAASNRRMEQRVERLLRANIRAMDSSFRVAANLFFMILSGVGLATAHSRVEALRRQCADEATASGDESEGTSISIGVASYPHTARERGEIVFAAETALAVARQRGGDQVALARIPFIEP